MNTPTRIVRLLFVVPLLAGALAVRTPAPAAAAQECTGFIQNRTIKNSLVVPTGSECELDKTVIRGGIFIEPGGGLVADESEIRGSVTGTDVAYASVTYSVVRGGYSVFGSESADLGFAEVRGDVIFTGATDRAFLQNATVRGNVTLNDNGLVTVMASTIAINLSCTGNDTVTNRDTVNTVGGQRLGDCQNV